MYVTHSIDARELLGQLQHDSDEQRLAVSGNAEELWDGHLLLHGHLCTLLLHLLHILPNILITTETHQCWGTK